MIKLIKKKKVEDVETAVLADMTPYSFVMMLVGVGVVQELIV